MTSEKHFLLTYEAVADYAEKRVPFRAAHLELAKASLEKGELILAGALVDPIDGSAFLFKGASDDAARAFAEADPYVQNGLIIKWTVREWMTVIGEGATNP
ncbi:MAG: YciI-like protein, partial [Pseudomonadota bacterium]